MLDLNHSSFKEKVANVAINGALDRAVLARAILEPSRGYLGASSIGHECLRRIQWDWRRPKPIAEAKTVRVFWRGHIFEGYIAAQFVMAGFDLQRGDIGFIQAGGKFRGHCDGKFVAGPAIEGVGYPCLWECKALGKASWSQIEKHGLKKAKPEYAAQVALYQTYLGLAEHPAIFSALNVENGELLNLLIPFDAELAQTASDRAVAVLRAEEHGETLPRVTDDPDHFLCRMCGHRAECWA